MTVKVLREEIVDTGANGLQFEAETYGELRLLPRNAEKVFAIFGVFERTGNGTLLYTSAVLDDWQNDYRDERHLLNSMDSEYLDDLVALRTGNVEIVERRGAG
jgi:hypothetical protein